MVHTPIDFLLSAALIGVTLPAVLRTILVSLLSAQAPPVVFPFWLAALASLLWIANQVYVLSGSTNQLSSSIAQPRRCSTYRGIEPG